MSGAAVLRTLASLRNAELALTRRRARATAGLIENLADPREIAFIALRYGIMGPPRSIDATAQMLGVSKARAAQIEGKAIARLSLGEAAVSKPSAMRKRRVRATPHELERVRASLAAMRRRHRASKAPSPSARRARYSRRLALERRIAELEGGAGR